MGMNMHVYGIRKATPEEVQAIRKDHAGCAEYEEWCNKNDIWPHVPEDGSDNDWDEKEVKVGLPGSGDMDWHYEIDVAALDKRITTIVLDKF